jgi:hypothetical protein
VQYWLMFIEMHVEAHAAPSPLCHLLTVRKMSGDCSRNDANYLTVALICTSDFELITSSTCSAVDQINVLQKQN